MAQMLRNDIFLDYLTGLPNFFKLMELDANKVFGECGSIIIIDIVNFVMVNMNYGKDMGDLCLRLMGKIIKELALKHENSSAFRTDGDEFTIILPNIQCMEAEKLYVEISTKFKIIMHENGFTDMDIHILKLDYKGNINSIEEFYKIVFDYVLKEIENGKKSKLRDWGYNIITSFTNRIRETLMFFTDVYNLALTDDVSGIFNSRAAKIHLNELMQRGKEESGIFSILFIDGDNLKRYNKVSYKCGNEMIEKLASVIKDVVSDKYRVYRWLSGDEFLVILNEVNEEEALKIAEKIRKEVEYKSKKWVYAVTVSIGVASYPKDGQCINEIVDKAEKANFLAKNSGKNKVIKLD